VTASHGKPASQVAGFVLAGGRSSRMGREKALLEIAGLPLVVRAVRRLEPLVYSVKVMGPAASLAPLGLSLLPDEVPGSGPLGAIATALVCADRPWGLVVACDMPYLSTEWLEYLIGRSLASKADVLLPESAYTVTPLPEPLCALYHQRAGATIRAALDRGVRKVMDGLAGLNIERVSPDDSKPFDSEGLLFQNLNSMEDFEAARARIERLERD
jgi:molybdopterin-guanine dinucleotide biosynthesis protein A